MIKIIRTDRVRSNVRIYYVAGFRALRDYQLKHALISGIQQQITLPLPEIPAGIQNLITERDQILRRIRAIQRQQIEGEIIRCVELSDTLVVKELSEFETPEIKYFAANLAKRGKHVVAYSRAATPLIVIARASGAFDLRSLTNDIFALLSGKGGGRENMIEGKPGDFSRLDDVIRLVKEKLGSD
jgi:alanyl-tRNA synthetase